MNELEMYVQIIYHNDKPVLQIRKIYSDPKTIKKIITTLLNEGQIKSTIKFLNTDFAILRLKKAGLI